MSIPADHWLNQPIAPAPVETPEEEDDGLRSCCRCGRTVDLNDYIDPQDFGPPDENVYCGANEWCTP